MSLPIELKPVESLVFRSDVVALGTFRCPAEHPMFRDSGPCTHHTVVFPRTSTVIRHAGGSSFTATPNCATLYNQNQEYTRKRVSNEDASDWIVLADDILRDLTRSDGERPFRAAHASVDSLTYMRQRRLFDAASAGDTLHIDEEAIAIVARIVAVGQTRNVSNGMRDKVETVKRMLAALPSHRFALRELAAAVDCSPFHLCRGFRDVTGMSITGYQHALRLRAALELLRDTNSDLSDIALSLGFASHSHFSALFRRHFGITPSQFRGH